MKYTVSKEADRKISEDMEIICKEINEKILGVRSIILTGGFSRGEGPVKKIGKKVYPYNDYDIQVIVDAKLSKKKIDKLATEISEKLGYKGINELFYPFRKEGQILEGNFYVDLKVDSPKSLKKLLPRIRTYELKNHSKIIYGKDIRPLIPDYDLKKIPLSEGAKLLLDRMSQMVEYYSARGKHEEEFLTYIIQQAYAACCTALLQLKENYKIGYANSMKILKKNYKKDYPELHKKIPGLSRRIEEFTRWKINPSKTQRKSVEKDWFIAKDDILEVSKYFFSKFLKKGIENVENLSREIVRMREEFYKPYLNELAKRNFRLRINPKLLLPFMSLFFKYNYYKRLKRFNCQRIGILFGNQPDLIIFGSIPFIIAAMGERGVDEEMLRKGKNLLNKIYPVTGMDWEEVSIDYANAYIAFFLQKI